MEVIIIILIVLILAILVSCIKIVPQAQAYVVERLGDGCDKSAQCKPDGGKSHGSKLYHD